MSSKSSGDNSALLKQLEDQELFIAKCRTRIDQRDKLILDLQERLELVSQENKKLHEIMLLHHRDSSNSPSQQNQSIRRMKAFEPNTFTQPSLQKSVQSRGLKPSIADLRAALSGLNEDIFQAAASLGDGMLYHQYPSSAEKWEIMKEKIERRIGGGILSILKETAAKVEFRRTNEVNSCTPVHSLLAQVTIQLFLAETVAYEMFAWSPQPDKTELSRELQKMYIGLQAAETHSVCARWRILTSSQLPISTDPTQWKENFKRKLSYLFHVACWRARDNAHLESFYRTLDPIYTALRYIRTSVWGMSEEEYEICFVKAGTTFDAAGMNEAYAAEKNRVWTPMGGTVVLGTASIGLCKVITNKNGFATKSVKLVAEPDVVVESSLRALLSLGLGESHSDGRD